MNAREVEAKARLLFDEYGPDAPSLAERRAQTFDRRAAGTEAAAWRAVHRRVIELARCDAEREASEMRLEPSPPGGGSRIGRLAGQIFGAARRPA